MVDVKGDNLQIGISLMKSINKTPQRGNSIQPKAAPWDNRTIVSYALKGQLKSAEDIHLIDK